MKSNLKTEDNVIIINDISFVSTTNKINDEQVTPFNMTDIDNITLDYFVNKTQYDSVLKKKGQRQCENFRIDTKFYKKRILDLTKKLFRDEIENEQVLSGFNSYLKTCISYLKFLDTNDIIQEKYIDESELTKNITDVSAVSMYDESYKNCDHLFGKVGDVKQVNLDSYVINNCAKNNKKLLPVKESVNIKTKEHRTKGIIKKKKLEI